MSLRNRWRAPAYPAALSRLPLTRTRPWLYSQTTLWFPWGHSDVLRSREGSSATDVRRPVPGQALITNPTLRPVNLKAVPPSLFRGPTMLRSAQVTGARATCPWQHPQRRRWRRGVRYHSWQAAGSTQDVTVLEQQAGANGTALGLKECFRGAAFPTASCFRPAAAAQPPWRQCPAAASCQLCLFSVSLC